MTREYNTTFVMPPSSSTRRSARKREPTSRQRSSAIAANNESPSRPPKRRRTQNAAARRQLESELADGRDEVESSGEEMEQPTDPVDEIIPVLKEADYKVAVATDCANKEQKQTIEAYAKIAGRTWTYYVTDPTINIGRSSDQRGHEDSSRLSESTDGANTHIDLGPHKLVSRVHAVISFDTSDERWHIKVFGRNGVRVNNQLCKKSQERALVSGDVLLVADTEMVFVSPDVPARIMPEYRKRLNPEVKTEETTNADAMYHAHPQNQIYNEPTHISPYAQPDNPGQVSTVPGTSMERQSTPVKNLMQAPYLAQNTDRGYTHGQQSQSQAQPAIMIENNNDAQVDYSSDLAKHVKPPMSYATLIGQAILSTPEEKLSLNGIYEWIKSHFSYYRHIEPGWQNSIRHNLSLNASFLRVDRDSHAPGKGGLWYIVPDKIEEHRKGGLKITSRGGARQSSNPSSPAPKRSPKKRTPPRQSSPIVRGTSSHAASQNPFQVNAVEAQTPSRAPRSSGLAHVETQPLPHLSDDASPLPTRTGPYTSQQTGRSPPTLGPSALYDDAAAGYSTNTPAPRRFEPQMTVPSTQKLPSQWLPVSSPAPFWKAFERTPGRFLDTSPIKHDNRPPVPESSSPPPLANGSPTRIRGASDSRVNDSYVNGLPSDPPAVSEERSVRARTPVKEDVDNDDDDDDAPLDLMGNFPRIGEKPTSNGGY